MDGTQAFVELRLSGLNSNVDFPSGLERVLHRHGQTPRACDADLQLAVVRVIVENRTCPANRPDPFVPRPGISETLLKKCGTESAVYRRMEGIRCICCGVETNVFMGGEPVCLECDAKREQALADRVKALNPPAASDDKARSASG